MNGPSAARVPTAALLEPLTRVFTACRSCGPRARPTRAPPAGTTWAAWPEEALGPDAAPRCFSGLPFVLTLTHLGFFGRCTPWACSMFPDRILKLSPRTQSTH